MLHISSMTELALKSELFNFAHLLASLYPKEVCSSLSIVTHKAIAWYAVGCYYYLIKNLALARRYFSKSTDLQRDFGPGWLGFGHAFAVEGEHDQVACRLVFLTLKALAAYRAAHRLLVGSHLPPVCIGVELVMANDLKLAKQFMLKVLTPFTSLIHVGTRDMPL